jgi:prepilin-type N-terminal cleavage/methylation domain-containing protein
MGPSRTPRRAHAGYTLVELMMVVMIIAISVMAFAPGFSAAMADRRVSTATRELIRIGRRARADTFGYLRAHLLWVQPGERRIQLLRGPTQSCTTPLWQDIQADCDEPLNSATHQRCVEDLDLDTWTRGDEIALREEILVGSKPVYRSTDRALCWSPSGRMFLAVNDSLEDAAKALKDVNDVNGGVVFTLHQGDGDPEIPPDTVHRVLFPLGASPRVLR